MFARRFLFFSLGVFAGVLLALPQPSNAQGVDYTTDYAYFAIAPTSYGLNLSASSSVTKTSTYWELSIVNQSVNGGLGIGTRFAYQPEITRTTQFLVDYEIISNTVGSGSLVGMKNATGSNHPQITPIGINPASGPQARATTTYTVSSNTSLAPVSFGASRSTTCNMVLRVYRISDQNGATIWSPVVPAIPSGSGTTTNITVNIPTTSTTTMLSSTDDVINTVGIYIIFFLTAFSIVLIFSPITKRTK